MNPNFHFNVSFQGLRVRTAQTAIDVDRALELRKQLFRSQNLSRLSVLNDLELIESDTFDEISDHILLEDEITDEIIGTGRLLSSEKTKKFFSEGEFDLSSFFNSGKEYPEKKDAGKEYPEKKDGKKKYLELSRVHVEMEYQKGPALQALWKGLAKYVELCEPEFLFGCSSFFNVDDRIGREMGQFLAKEYGKLDFDIRPNFQFNSGRETAENFDFSERGLAKIIPALLRSYLRMGAKVCPLPAFDPKLETTSFFAFLDNLQLKSMYRRGGA